jgi:hypothetical protein
MSNRNTANCCNDRFAKEDVVVFLTLNTTRVSKDYLTHWNSLDDNDIRCCEIKLSQFTGAERITCIKKDAYDLFKTTPDATIHSCHTVFSDWEGEDSEVTFWMTDQNSDACTVT